MANVWESMVNVGFPVPPIFPVYVLERSDGMIVRVKNCGCLVDGDAPLLFVVRLFFSSSHLPPVIYTKTKHLTGYLNDLWRYRVSDNTWTWFSGSNTEVNLVGVYGEKTVPSANNYPGGRYHALGWFDSTNQEFWVFGGEGNDNEGYYGA